MPQSAVIEVKAKAGKEEFGDKIEMEIGGYVAVAEEPVCAQGNIEIDLFAGPKECIDFVMLKSDMYRRKEDQANSCTLGDPKRWIEAAFFADGGQADEKGTFELRHGLFLGTKCVMELLPAKVDKVKIENPLPIDIKISVLVVRKKKAQAQNGNGQLKQALEMVPKAG